MSAIVKLMGLFRLPCVDIRQVVKILQIIRVPGVGLVFIFIDQPRPAFGAHWNAVRRIRFDAVFNAALRAFDDKNIHIHIISHNGLKGVL